jgi:endoribonuclease LACTB2
VLLTHHHEDHTGNAAAVLAMYPSATVHGHAGTLAHLVADRPFPVQWYRRLVWGPASTVPAARARASDMRVFDTPAQLLQHLAGRSLRCDDDGAAVMATLGDGTRLGLYALAHPGHCEDHIMLFAPQRGWLFSGDGLVTPKPKLAFVAEDVPAILRSLEGVVDPSFAGHVSSGGGARMHAHPCAWPCAGALGATRCCSTFCAGCACVLCPPRGAEWNASAAGQAHLAEQPEGRRA